MGIRIGTNGDGWRISSLARGMFEGCGLYGSKGAGRECMAMMMYCAQRILNAMVSQEQRVISTYRGKKQRKESGISKAATPHAEGS